MAWIFIKDLERAYPLEFVLIYGKLTPRKWSSVKGEMRALTEPLILFFVVTRAAVEAKSLNEYLHDK